MIIALDGPAGSGKGTVCRILSQTLGWPYLDIGMIFRFVATHGDRFLTSEAVYEDGAILFGGNFSKFENEEYGKRASIIAKQNLESLAIIARRLACNWTDFICDGRGSGTKIFKARKIYYLTAIKESRAARKSHQCGITFEEALASIQERDERDDSQIPQDGVIIDTTHISPERCSEIILHDIKSLP